MAGHSSTLGSLVNAFDSALAAHPPSPFPPDETPSLDSQDGLMTCPACSHGRGTLKKPIFATRSLMAGHSSTLGSLLVNAFDSALAAHPPSPFPPDEKPSLDSQDVLVAASARSHGRGTLKKPIFATRCLLDHPLPLEPLMVSVSAPAHSPLPPWDEKPSLDSQDVLVAASARSHGRGTLKKPIFATRCLLGHPLPLEPLISISASAPSPSPSVHTLLLRRSGS